MANDRGYRMIKTFRANSLNKIEQDIDDYARKHSLRVDCFSIVYTGVYEALVKFGVRL